MGNTCMLSKSRYCTALQCEKALWLSIHKPEEAVSTGNESVLNSGTIVGEIARSYFGDYVLVTYSSDKSQMIEETKKYMENGADNIAEASFAVGASFCQVDILKRNEDGWDIVEVKSSTSVSDIYIEDVAYQYYVLKTAGINVKKVYFLYINNQYVRNGDLDLKSLFNFVDYTEEAIKRIDIVKERIPMFIEYASQADEPEKDIDLCCEKPYECSFRAYCGKHLPKPSVFDVAGLSAKKAYELYHSGVVSFEDIIQKKVKLSDKQRFQVEHFVKNSSVYIDKTQIKEFLKTVHYPLYHLDFETFQTPIPEVDGVRPYQQIPFQYSLHIQKNKGEKPEHKEFLAKEGLNPLRAIAESLCKDIPKDVCSMAFNTGFEKGRIKELAKLFPDLSDHLMNIHNNMIDLMVPFQKMSYYSNTLMGSYSIKQVLPTMCPGDPELDYHALEGIHNGGEAMAAFPGLEKKSPEEIATIRKQLLAYCCLDTLAMVKVLEKLYQIAEE